MPILLLGDRQLDLRQYQTDPDLGKSMGAYIVQFQSELTPQLMDLLDKELIRELSPAIAIDALICRMGTDMAKHLRATYPEIYAVAHYRPEWKLFMPLEGTGTALPLQIVTFPAYELDVANLAGSLGGENVHHRPFSRSVRVGQFDPAHLLDLAASDWIISIAALPEVQTQDNAALPLMGVTPTGRYGPDTQGYVPDTGSNPPEPTVDQIKVTGAGQIVCVADTGLDTGATASLHPAFKNSTLGTGYGRENDWSDPDGHGTHVAGIAIGVESFVEGVAPDADLAMQSIDSGFAYNDKRGYWSPRLNTTALVEMLEEARTTFHAGVHNNSWGGGHRYTGDAFVVDEFSYRHPDMTIVVAAGNDGPGPSTILSPGTAKNVITVGSSSNNLSLTTAPGVQGDLKNSLPLAGDRISDFSSRGPTKDGRIKPDVVAPGEGILSAKSTVADNIRYPHFFASRGTHEVHTQYMWDNGTSMAAPGVAGAVALLREWLKDKEDLARRTPSPSSALIKALLINGADRVVQKGGRLLGLADETWGGWGSPQQGWGRVNVSNIINPQKGIRVWWEDEAVPLEEGDVREYQFNVAAPPRGETPGLLKITLVWRDPPAMEDPTDTGPSTTAAKLQHNLDLEVLGPGGVKYVGNSFTGQRTTSKEYADTETRLPYDDRNNVECVIIDPVAAGSLVHGPKDISGSYKVRIIARQIKYPNPTVAKQPFALVVSGYGLTKGQISGRLGQRLQVPDAAGELNTPLALTATLTGTPAPDNVPVTFTVDGQSKTENTVHGVATWADFTPTRKGSFDIQCRFDGQGQYEAASGTGELLVKGTSTRLTNLNPVSAQFAQNFAVSAVLETESDGTVLNGKTVHFAYGGRTVSATMNGGTAGATFMCTETGVVSCWFDGDAEFEECSGSLPVSPTPAIAGIAVLDVAASYGDTERIRAIWGAFPSQPKAGDPLNFLVATGSTPNKVGRVRTDSNGFARCSFTVLQEPGTHQIIVRDEVDPLTERYTVSGIANLTVTQASGSLYIETRWASCHQPVNVVATLTPRTPGHAVKLTVDGVTKTLTTGKNGSVEWTVGPFDAERKVKIKAEFAGDQSIAACAGAEYELSVRKKAGRLQVQDAVSKAKQEPVLEATLTPAVSGRQVKFKVGSSGPWKTAVTTDGGKVTVSYPALATAGDYHIQAEFTGDAGIGAVYGAGVLRVEG